MSENGSTKNGWGALDTWGKRLLTIVVPTTLIIGGAFSAWARMNSRVEFLEQQVAVMQRCLDEKIAPMRDDVVALRTDVAAVKDDIAEIKDELKGR